MNIKLLMLWHGAVVGAYHKWLEELVKQGVKLTLIMPPFWGQPGDKIISAEVRESPHYKIIIPRTIWNHKSRAFFYPALLKYLYREKPTIIHLYEEPFSFTAFQTVFFRNLFFRRTPIVIQTLDNIYYEYSKPYSFYERYCLKHSDYAIGCCKDIEINLQRKGFHRVAGPQPNGLPPGLLTKIVLKKHNFADLQYKNVNILPLGVDPKTYFPIHAKELKKQLGLDSFTIGYAGRLIEAKGLDRLINAASELQRNFKILIIGNGPFRESLVKLAEQKDIRNHIVLLEHVPHNDIARYYNCMDVLVLPSQTTPGWKEQFGRVLAEAMLCRIPVVGSDSGSIPEVIGDAGMVFPENNTRALKDCLQKLMDNESLRKDLAEKGYNRAMEKFTWEKVAEENIKVYGELIKRNE